MRIHFFTAPFTLLSFGSGFRVQGSGFRALVAASPPFLEDGILVSQPSPLGNAAIREYHPLKKAAKPPPEP